MTIYKIDPLQDPRWHELVMQHPAACAFHTTGWLSALKETYRYAPVAFTTTPPGAPLRNGIVFCQINSWLTGRRLVSLPFSDHTQPLADSGETEEILRHLQSCLANGHRYVEIRPMDPVDTLSENNMAGKAKSFYLNLLSLEPDLDTLFAGFHKSCVQRAIKRTQRDGIKTECGTSPEILQKFYILMLKTRRRHLLPPQPLEWFQNISKHMGDALKIRVASKDDQPISALLSISHLKSIIYKYGCSDDQYFSLGGIFALFWEMIQDAKNDGATTLDLGRSDLTGDGLIQFKDRWGSQRREISYYRSPAPPPARETNSSFREAIAQRLFPHLPDNVLIMIGKALYRHTG